jgi:hypothetical protein
MTHFDVVGMRIYEIDVVDIIQDQSFLLFRGISKLDLSHSSLVRGFESASIFPLGHFPPTHDIIGIGIIFILLVDCECG